MPRAARACASSRKGLFGPSVSSRSCGPLPCTSTTAGTGFDRSLGKVSVPESSIPPCFTTKSSSVNASAASVRPGVAGCVAVAGAGVKVSPASSNSSFSTTFICSGSRSKRSTLWHTCIPCRSVSDQASCFSSCPACVSSCFQMACTMAAESWACTCGVACANTLSACPVLIHSKWRPAISVKRSAFAVMLPHHSRSRHKICFISSNVFCQVIRSKLRSAGTVPFGELTGGTLRRAGARDGGDSSGGWPTPNKLPAAHSLYNKVWSG